MKVLEMIFNACFMQLSSNSAIFEQIAIYGNPFIFGTEEEQYNIFYFIYFTQLVNSDLIRRRIYCRSYLGMRYRGK